mmetsp:Transcript_102369/g.187784  ORF Transcript_102369/g.187784 Transcript_102369/m.187784 type:complete len:202 (-) Transcript_102369:578-1183(-)
MKAMRYTNRNRKERNQQTDKNDVGNGTSSLTPISTDQASQWKSQHYVRHASHYQPSEPSYLELKKRRITKAMVKGHGARDGNVAGPEVKKRYPQRSHISLSDSSILFLNVLGTETKTIPQFARDVSHRCGIQASYVIILGGDFTAPGFRTRSAAVEHTLRAGRGCGWHKARMYSHGIGRTISKYMLLIFILVFTLGRTCLP